jgi:hypothetical protein
LATFPKHCIWEKPMKCHYATGKADESEQDAPFNRRLSQAYSPRRFSLISGE